MSLFTFIPSFGGSAALMLIARTLIINECESRLQDAARLCEIDTETRASLIYNYTRKVVADPMDLCR